MEKGDESQGQASSELRPTSVFNRIGVQLTENDLTQTEENEGRKKKKGDPRVTAVVQSKPPLIERASGPPSVTRSNPRTKKKDPYMIRRRTLVRPLNILARLPLV